MTFVTWLGCAPSLAEDPDLVIQEANYLVVRAVDPELECLYLRGLFPSSLIQAPLAQCVVPAVSVGSVPVDGMVWPSGWYFTDGSGGQFVTILEFRRCGWGLAHMGGASFRWCLFVPLPGGKMMYPGPNCSRCLWWLLILGLGRMPVSFLTPLSQWPCIIVDQNILAGALPPNADLWKTLRYALVCKPSLRRYWVKAHMLGDPELHPIYVMPLAFLVGNAVADYLADRGGEMAVLDGVTTKSVIDQFAMVHQIQKRLLHVVSRDIEPRSYIHRPHGWMAPSPFHASFRFDTRIG